MKSIKFSFMDRDICLQDNHLLVVIENKDIWSSLMTFMYSGFVLESEVMEIYEEEKKLDVDDFCHFISNPYFLELNTKKNIQALYKKLKIQYFDKLKDNLAQINEIAEKTVKDISVDYDVDLSMVAHIKEDDIFKLMSVQFSDLDTNKVERFVKYIEITNDLQRINVFISVHLKESFSEEELLLIEKQLLYKKIYLVDFETNDLDSNALERKVIVDKDLCVVN